MAAPEQALGDLVAAVREDDTLLTDHLREPEADPALGRLAAAGSRAAGAEDEYAFVVEAVREGYLLHYSKPRILGELEPDLALLAGDHLYALGLERLAGLGDLEAVRELGDLISLSASIHADGAGDDRTAAALWLASAAAVAAGGSTAHHSAKEALRERGPGPDCAQALWGAAAGAAAEGGFVNTLTQAADSIDFDAPDPSHRG